MFVGIMPVVTLLFAVLFLGEHLTLHDLMGMGLIGAAILFGAQKPTSGKSGFIGFLRRRF